MNSLVNRPREMNRQYEVDHFIRQWRMHRGLTVDALAAKAGCSSSLISQLERGKAQFSVVTLKQLGTALDCEPWQLLAAAPSDDLVIWQSLAGHSCWRQVKREHHPALHAMLNANCAAAIKTALELFGKRKSE